MNEGFDMNQLVNGSLWDLPGGKRVEVISDPFIWGGKRWVPVFDHDFDQPFLFPVARFEGARNVD
jgi:hypothetical protein